MLDLLKRSLVTLLCCAIATVGLPRATRGGTSLSSGENNANDAAALDLGESRHAGGRAMFSAFAADTTEYEFPDEVTDNRNIVKEVIIWTAVAGVVAFFIIAVFLQGDTDEPADTGGGGKDPGGDLGVSGQPLPARP